MRCFVGLAALCSAVFFFIACQSEPMPAAQDAPAWAIAIHGGAGAIEPSSMDAATEQAYGAALDAALSIGETLLADGGTSLDAVEAVVAWMEDNPLFNAGRGAVFTYEGRNELDASIMDGSTRNAG